MIMELRRLGIVDTDLLAALERTSPIVDTAAAYKTARLIQALAVKKHSTVLETDAGTANASAVLCQLGRRLYATDADAARCRVLQKNLIELGFTNFVTEQADAGQGWPHPVTFHRILAHAPLPSVPAALLTQLADGGILVMPVTDAEGVWFVLKVHKTDQGFVEEIERHPLQPAMLHTE
jgi:protein-L-isoaspartate(D-aspartate) O-methyltransferase